MRWIVAGAWVVGSAGCTDDAGTADGSGTLSDPTAHITDPGPTLDPDVDSYLPPEFADAMPERVVFLGDSITAGYGLNNDDNSYVSLLLENNDNKWPDHGESDLAARFAGLDVLDVSVPGATTGSLMAGQLPRVETSWGTEVSGEVMVVITIGGNDLTDALFSGGNADQAADQALDNIESIVDFFHDPARFPDGAWVYITNVYEPTDGVGQVDACFFGLDLSSIVPTFERLGDESRALAESQGWALIDLRGHFLGHGFHFEDEGDWYHPDDPTLWFQDDCIHPNVRGHHELRRLFLAAIDGADLTLEP